MAHSRNTEILVYELQHIIYQTWPNCDSASRIRLFLTVISETCYLVPFYERIKWKKSDAWRACACILVILSASAGGSWTSENVPCVPVVLVTWLNVLIKLWPILSKLHTVSAVPRSAPVSHTRMSFLYKLAPSAFQMSTTFTGLEHKDSNTERRYRVGSILALFSGGSRSFNSFAGW
jgi:hypothetical protein